MSKSTDKETSSSTYSDYKSNYDITINADEPVKNKLINLYDEPHDIFMLKNDLYTNYGIEKYLDVVEKYNQVLDEYEFDRFDQTIWNKCVELNGEDNIEPKQRCCPFMCFKKKVPKTNAKNMQKLYNFLHEMHVNNTKTKLWLDIVIAEKNKT